MLCAEQDSLQQEHREAISIFRASLFDLVVLVENSAEDSGFTLAHLRIRATCGACEVARAALEHHQVEHGC
jgi:predicted metal-binding protein